MFPEGSGHAYVNFLQWHFGGNWNLHLQHTVKVPLSQPCFFVFGLLSCLFLQVSSVRPTWFEDIAAPKDTTSQSNQDPQWQQSQPLHGLKLVIKEEVLPMKDQPEFPSLELLATRGLLAPDTWKCKRAQVSLKATIDVPMLGTIIEQNGDGLLEDSICP